MEQDDLCLEKALQDNVFHFITKLIENDVIQDDALVNICHKLITGIPQTLTENLFCGSGKNGPKRGPDSMVMRVQKVSLRSNWMVSNYTRPIGPDIK